jgi:hypothetical protein
MEFDSVWLRFALTLGLMSAMVTLSLIPGRNDHDDSVLVRLLLMIPKDVQKIAHFLLYALLAFLVVWVLETVLETRPALLAAFVVATGFGAAMELAQRSVPGRFGTVRDVQIDAAGAVIGLAAAVAVF